MRVSACVNVSAGDTVHWLMDRLRRFMSKLRIVTDNVRAHYFSWQPCGRGLSRVQAA